MSVNLEKVQSIRVEAKCYSPCQHQCVFVFEDGQEKSMMCEAEKIAEFYKTAFSKVHCSLDEAQAHFNENSRSSLKKRSFCTLL